MSNAVVVGTPAVVQNSLCVVEDAPRRRVVLAVSALERNCEQSMGGRFSLT